MIIQIIYKVISSIIYKTKMLRVFFAQGYIYIPNDKFQKPYHYIKIYNDTKDKEHSLNESKKKYYESRGCVYKK
jgi:hypothetical protein